MIWYLLLYALCCIAIFLLVKTNFSEIKTWQKFLILLILVMKASSSFITIKENNVRLTVEVF